MSVYTRDLVARLVAPDQLSVPAGHRYRSFHRDAIGPMLPAQHGSPGRSGARTCDALPRLRMLRGRMPPAPRLVLAGSPCLPGRRRMAPPLGIASCIERRTNLSSRRVLTRVFLASAIRRDALAARPARLLPSRQDLAYAVRLEVARFDAAPSAGLGDAVALLRARQ